NQPDIHRRFRPLIQAGFAVTLFAETRLDKGPKSAVNVGLIEGGSGVNAIAQAARAKVDIRSESNARIEELVDILASAVDRARDAENQRTRPERWRRSCARSARGPPRCCRTGRRFCTIFARWTR